jgi:pathogenesis-related protein 1
MKFLHRTSLILLGLLFLQSASLSAGAGQLFVNNSSQGSRVTPKEAQQMVALHNTIRAQVGVGPVRWSEEVAAFAQQWADHLASSRCGMEHRPRSGKWQQQYGENLFIGTASHYGTSDAVMAWAGEKTKYHGGPLQSSRWADAGHYTQMVWRDTLRIGCATAVCKGMLIVVCNYDPRGNYLGQSPY